MPTKLKRNSFCFSPCASLPCLVSLIGRAGFYLFILVTKGLHYGTIHTFWTFSANYFLQLIENSQKIFDDFQRTSTTWMFRNGHFVRTWPASQHTTFFSSIHNLQISKSFPEIHSKVLLIYSLRIVLIRVVYFMQCRMCQRNDVEKDLSVKPPFRKKREQKK